ncbi:MAG: 3'-5' exonuclease [Elusimicrobiota bacterium]
MPRTRTSAKGSGLKTPLEDVTFAFLDTETTGLSPSWGARLCELAILFVRNGETIDEYQTLIDPETPMDPGAQRIHGISDEMVAGKPTFRQIAAEVRERLRGTVIVCHNLQFDKRFMAAEFQDAGLTVPDIPELCTLQLARRQFSFQRNGLGHIVDCEIDAEFKQRHGLTSDGAHRAMHDVRLLHGVFRYLISKLPPAKHPKTLGDLLRLVKK